MRERERERERVEGTGKRRGIGRVRDSVELGGITLSTGKGIARKRDSEKCKGKYVEENVKMMQSGGERQK